MLATYRDHIFFGGDRAAQWVDIEKALECICMGVSSAEPGNALLVPRLGLRSFPRIRFGQTEVSAGGFSGAKP